MNIFDIFKKKESKSNREPKEGFVFVDFAKLEGTDMVAYPWEYHLEAMEHNNEFGNSIIEVPIEVYNEALEKIRKHKLFYEYLSKYASCNSLAKQEEKNGNYDKAIELYKQNIDLILNREIEFTNYYFYPFERLCIIYRKLKMYNEELACIDFAIEKDIVLKDNEMIVKRREKILKLMTKQSK